MSLENFHHLTNQQIMHLTNNILERRIGIHKRIAEILIGEYMSIDKLKISPRQMEIDNHLILMALICMKVCY